MKEAFFVQIVVHGHREYYTNLMLFFFGCLNVD